MLPLGTAWAAARKSRKNGGFLRILTRYDGDPSGGSRPAKHGLLFAVHGQPVGGSLPAAGAICPPDHGQPVDGSRLPVDGSRPAVRGLVCLGL